MDHGSKIISLESAKQYIQDHLHMTQVTKIQSADSDYWFFKGNNESGEWMELRVHRNAPGKYFFVAERPWENRYEHAWAPIDAIPVWNGEPSDDVDSYLPKN